MERSERVARLRVGRSGRRSIMVASRTLARAHRAPSQRSVAPRDGVIGRSDPGSLARPSHRMVVLSALDPLDPHVVFYHGLCMGLVAVDAVARSFRIGFVLKAMDAPIPATDW